ncbi:hypothetical protein [Zunongwangia sp.]|uniref:hypothetical protein n=1 Tax=Zunongwangia sp. TaxID=1965325 RepID=UPI003AA98ED5
MKSIKSLKTEKKLQRIKDHFDLSKLDLQILDKLLDYEIYSICCTTDGGFDRVTGEFYCEERMINYKIKIIYRDNKKPSKAKHVLLKPEMADTVYYRHSQKNILNLQKAS